MKPDKALIIYAKLPTSGRVKTRLTPPLHPETAASLYGCMLLDTIAKTKALQDIHIAIHYQNDPGAEEYFAANAPGIESRPQEGHDLGTRMENSFDHLFRRGFRSIAVIGSDSPDLPTEYILRTYDLLADGIDAVFGPADDGGYYLLAMNSPHGELFRDLPWSSCDLLATSLERARKMGISTAQLPKWYDIDTAEDLERIRKAGGIPSAPLTDGFLRENLICDGQVRELTTS